LIFKSLHTDLMKEDRYELDLKLYEAKDQFDLF